jgi:Na+-transporting NADH:ubiquinone oxidoreductase subunit NqrC
MNTRKYIAQYINICLLFVFLLSMSLTLQAAPKSAEEVQKKKKEQDEQKRMQAEADKQQRLSKHFAMQSKEVKKRMKENQKVTANYYDRKRSDCWFTDLFRKKYRH